MGSKQSEKVTRYRKNIKNKMVLSMGGKCQICGYSKCNDALEFHHLDSNTKEFGFGKLRSNPKKLSVLLNELSKCILLCAICHREVHAGIRAIPDEYPKLDPSIFGWVSINGGFEKKLNSIEVKEIPEKNVDVKNRKLKFEISEIDLKILLDSKSLCEIGRMFGVSDNAIRKRAKKFGIL